MVDVLAAVVEAKEDANNFSYLSTVSLTRLVLITRSTRMSLMPSVVKERASFSLKHHGSNNTMKIVAKIGKGIVAADGWSGKVSLGDEVVAKGVL